MSRLKMPTERPDAIRLRASEVLGLAGLLGSGTDRVLRRLFGLEAARQPRAHQGRVARLARPTDAIRAGIGMVPGERRLGLVMNLSVRDNILLPSLDRLTRGGRIDRAAGDRLVAELMELLDIRPRDASLRAAALSGGNQQKVILAKWLARKVGVLLLDEPTQGVDVAAKAQIHALIRDFAKRGGGGAAELQRSRRADPRLRQHLRLASGPHDRAARPRGWLRRKAAARRHRRMTMRKRFNLAGQIPLITLVALCVVTALLTDRFLSPLNLTNILVQSSIMAVIAIGMTFVIIGGGFDLSVGSTVALAGCVAAMVMVKFGIAAGVLAGIATGAAVGLANGLIIAKLGVNPFITTLGTMVLVRGLVFLITGGAPVGDDGLPSAFIAFGSERFLGIHYLVWVPAILLVVLSWVMHATPYGRRIYATGGNREAAYLSGVPVERIVASTYVWCGALAGVAGVMLAARLQSGQPTAGEFYELTAIAAVVLGGAALHGGEGTLYKSIIGVFIMIVLGNSLNLLNVDSYWQRVAIGAVIIAAAAADRLRSRALRACKHGRACPCSEVRGSRMRLAAYWPRNAMLTFVVRRGAALPAALIRACIGAAEDHHRRLARPGRQPVLHRHAARHPRPRPGARLGGRDRLGQRGQGQADQRRAGPGGARRQGHSDLADRRGRRERRL